MTREKTKILQQFSITGLIIIAIITIGYTIWEIPRYLQPATEKLPADSQELINIQNEYRKIFVQVIGGIAILYGLFLNARRTEALEETARSNEQGQITERFTKAIDQLGSNKLEVRLGGIYALE